LTKPRHIRVRSDFWTHPKTAWMSSIHRDLCCYMAAHSHLGIIRHSAKALSSDLGEPEHVILSALGDLEYNGHVRCYEEIGAWWLVEAADENLDGRSWRSAFKEFEKLPEGLFSHVLDRYAQQLWDHRPERETQVCEIIASKLNQPNADMRVSVSVSVSDKKKERLDYHAIAAALGEARTKILGRTSTIDPDGKAFRQQVAKPPGATTELWLTAIRRQARSLRNDPDGASKWLTTSTIHRQQNWQRLLERDDLDPPQETKPERGW
jgi:hypothetical protein